MRKRYGAEPQYATSEIISTVAQNLANFLYQNELTRNSKVIVVGGKIANEWEHLSHSFIDETRHNMGILFYQSGFPTPNLEVSLLGNNVGIVGGWAIAMKQLTGKWPKYPISLIPNGSYAKISQLSPAIP